MNPLVLQVGIAGPLVMALIVHVAVSRERSPIHHILLALLVMILFWMIGTVFQASDSDTVRLWGRHLLVPSACAMSPLFFLMMARYKRFEFLERAPAIHYAILAPFFIFYLAFVTNDWHNLMMQDSETDPFGPNFAGTAGPLFWAFQVWSNLAAAAGVAIAVHLFRHGQWSDERRRLLLLIAAAGFPLAAHIAFLANALPFDYPLTPAALGLTAVFMVMAIHRYRLLEVQPVARRDVIEASSDAVILANADGVVVDANPAASALLGCETQTLLGNPIGSALSVLQAPELERLVELARAQAESGEAPLRELVSLPDGHVLELVAGAPIDASGRRAGYFVAMRDRTAERRAEKQLQQSQKLESVGVLAAGVAHEVNNPLAFVRANLNHLHELSSLIEQHLDAFPREKARDFEDMGEVIEDSLSGLDRIAHIVEGMLAFSRVPHEERVLTDLNDVVRESIRFANLEISQQVMVVTDLAVYLPAVPAVSSQLVQVVLNLLLNAKRVLAGRADARVIVRTHFAGDHVVVSVQDNGPGIPEEIEAKIFDPFFTTGDPNEGTGLGLSIAFDIVREHGGALELCSGELDGACFCIHLPLASNPE